MPQRKRNILVTRSLSGKQREYAWSLGLNPIEKPALKFEFPEHWDDILKIISTNNQSDWVFTSQNGVKALEKLMNEVQVDTKKQIFAVGSKTRQALQKLEIDAKIPSQHDGHHLAKFIIERGKTDSVIHFRGNLSHSDMKDELIRHNIKVTEAEVYKTLIQPVTLPDKSLDAILFYSPSAVKGFKRGQGFGQSLPPLFAIGPTTANALEKETNQSVNIANKPDTKILLQTVSSYLSNKEGVA